jgi:glucose-1-phosphate thymidylyltransferase
VADRPGDFIKYLIKKEDVYAFEFTGKWFDIGCVESYLDAHRAMPGIFSQKKLINTRTKGSIYVGENSLIENSKIHDSIIFDNVKIHNSEISNCIIDSGSIVKNVKLENELIESGSKIAG